MRYPLLPKWALLNKLPAYYDWESLTAVDQTAKLYGTIQGLIEDYNKFADETNKAIQEFVTGINSDQECFEKKITKIVHDYIITIDAKIAHQDRVIEESIEYIKSNIGETVVSVINEMKESGELTEELTRAFEELGSRVSSLETANTEKTAQIEGLTTRIVSLENQKPKLIYNAETESLNFENVEVVVNE